MGLDYYKILKVKRNASKDDVRKSYVRLAKKWHPDKNLKKESEAEAIFKQISEAYHVLSDPNKRRKYDFRTSGEMKKAVTVEHPLLCSLEELYKGATKKMKITRTVLDPVTWEIRNAEEILTIDIKPGWKKGTGITFPGRGNYQPGLLPADVTFVVNEKPHPVYERYGNDLVIKQTVTLLESLIGKVLELTTLDGRHLPIALTEIIKPGHEMIIPDEGMPIFLDPRDKGCLRIKFDVEYPTRLTAEQKNDLKRGLG